MRPLTGRDCRDDQYPQILLDESPGYRKALGATIRSLRRVGTPRSYQIVPGPGTLTPMAGKGEV